MAEDKNDVSNIKNDYNNAISGLDLDKTSNQIAKGKLTFSLNSIVESYSGNNVTYQNELGNEFCVEFPTGYVLIGKHFIPERNKHIFFIANPSENGSQIGYMDNNDCQYRVLVNSPCLGFDVNHPVHKIVHKITNCSTEIFWADHIARRYLDIDDVPRVLKSGTALCNPYYTDDLDCNQLKVQPNFSIPSLSVSDVSEGGTLLAGTYQFAIQYSDSIGNPYTSYYAITNPTPISDPNITTQNFDYPVGKSIVVDVQNIDITGQFENFNLAVIKTVNAISTVELVGTYFIDGSDKKVVYTGQVLRSLNINDIFEKFPYYEIADDVAAVQDVLIWKGLTSIDRVNYQKIANKISLQWETWRIPPSENYADEVNATNLRSYLRDEVYSFEFVPLLDNGKQLDGFHIPGRVMNSSEVLTPDVPPTNPDSTYDVNVPHWKVYNTATVLGTDPNYNPNDVNYKGSYQYGDFSYCESTETYPCNEEVWGELAGKPIRHHKFPDIVVSPIFESDDSLSLSAITMGNKAVFPIGVRINIQQIRTLIEQSSDLTREEKDAIVGFKLIRGDRSTNKSIIAKGMLRNVGKYTREEQDYYFPNYPYNDLRQDPFLSATNNAFSQLCKPFLIQIKELVSDPSGGQGYVEIEYINCDTNKQTRKTYTSIISEEICSIGKPVVVHGDASISHATYDIWTAVANGINGFRIQWDDITIGITDKWVDGFSSTQLYVVKDSSPVQISGSENVNTTYLRTVFATTDCSVLNEMTPIEEDDSLAYRQIFNSPETSFGQPFLGSVLKLESVMYGKGKAHFVEVKDNAKYKLITEEAQRDALESSVELANFTTPFDSTALFTAYQAYLQVYINGITRRNYAYSFNSIADYNQSIAVPNNQGVKIRKIEIGRYLIPAVLNVGDDANFNNYQRESSVFLKTEEEETPFLFPHDSPSVITKGIQERSRFTISEIDNCDKPAKEEEINVASYYASIKNNIDNQWGQIYSYGTVDTGLQIDLKTYNKVYTVAFGGDTFISRFAYKVKLPFFIDNRVGAPDDSDIFYDEIGNVAYPKYWHSSRSILKDYSSNVTNSILTNIISYKAHNFDCPNSQGEADETDVPGRTYYDGYFYLFAYGVPSFYCESSYNVDLRQAFNNREGDFWPHVSTGIPDDWVQEKFVSINNDNTYTYNSTYSKQNRENSFSHLPVDWTDDQCLTSYPFRAIYSDAQNIDSDNRLNNWLIYRAISYFDFPQNFGAIISIDGIQNSAILARFENKTLLYNSLITIDTSNPQSAYIGNPQLFRGAPPIDYAETDLGFVGSQNKMLLKIPQGQITIDVKRTQIFLLSGKQAVDLTGIQSGVSMWMKENLSFKILKYFPTVATDNHFNGIGIHGVFDSKYNRVIITKLDYIPLSDNVRFDKITGEYYIENSFNGFKIREQIFLSDPLYFCNKSFTISFNFNTKSWVSFHSYIPNFYIGENNFFYSGLNNCCSDFEFVIAENIVGIPGGLDNTSVTYDECGNEINNLFNSDVCFPTSTSTTTILSCVMNGEGVIITPPNPTTTLLSCSFDGNGVVVVQPFITTSSTTSTLFPGTTTTSTTFIPIVCPFDIFYDPSGIPVPVGWVDESAACGGIGQLLVVYVIGNLSCPVDIYDVYSQGKTLYTDSDFLSPLNGNNSWMKTVSGANLGEVFLVGVDGKIIQFNSINCNGSPTTTSTSSSTSTSTSSSTSSTSTSSTTLFPVYTTSTTTLSPDACDLDGYVNQIDCEFEGTGVITIPSDPEPCVRPDDLEDFNLGIGYGIISSGDNVSTIGSKDEACDGIAWINIISCGDVNTDFVVNYIGAQSNGLEVGNTVFVGGGNDCNIIDDGWYFLNESLTTNLVYHIVEGILVEIASCTPTTSTTSTTIDCPTTSTSTTSSTSTTTTTTTAEPTTSTTSTTEEPTTSTSSTSTTEVPSTTTTSTTLEDCGDGYSYNVAYYSCADCSNIGGGTICNEFKLTIGKWYYDSVSGLIIHITGFISCTCDFSSYHILDITKKNACNEVLCPTTTTSTTTIEPTTSSTTSTTLEPTTSTSTSSSSTSTTSTTGLPVGCVEYGLLYNWYAVDDVRELAPTGWRVPSISDFQTLADYLGAGGNYLSNSAGGPLKETGLTYWNSPNTGATNSTGFNGRGAGGRTSFGFSSLKESALYWASTLFVSTAANAGNLAANDDDFQCPSNVGYSLITGYPVRLIKDDSIDNGTLVGNDGNIYKTVTIGSQVWISENLAETKYRNGDNIVNVTDQTAWNALETGAYCAYNNDSANIGCWQGGTSTTTSTSTTIV